MFDLDDIKSVQAQRPDLNEDDACEVLGFLNDITASDGGLIWSGTQEKLFLETANYIFPAVKYADN